MSTKSNYWENALVNQFLRGVAIPAITPYVALFLSDPLEDASGTEVSAGGYARVTGTFDAPVDGVTQNTTPIVFPQATADWGLVTHFAIFDAVTLGNMLYYGPLSSSAAVLLDDTFRFLAGDLTINET